MAKQNMKVYEAESGGGGRCVEAFIVTQSNRFYAGEDGESSDGGLRVLVKDLITCS